MGSVPEELNLFSKALGEESIKPVGLPRFPSQLLFLRAGCLGGHQLSGAQFCGGHWDAVAWQGGVGIFFGGRPDGSGGRRGF